MMVVKLKEHQILQLHIKQPKSTQRNQKNENKNSYKEIIEENSKLQLRIQKLIENETVTNDKLTIADKNKDGKINSKEFLAFIKNARFLSDSNAVNEMKSIFPINNIS